MDLHPIIVHFPIALLTIYAIMELFRFKVLLKAKSWFYVKGSFLIIGVLGALAALSSGDFAADQYLNNQLRPLIEIHETVAGATTVIFAILAITYILTWVDKNYGKELSKLYEGKFKGVWYILIKVKNFLTETPIIYLLVILGLLGITMTGALGGALVYPASSDPLISLMHNLFL